MAIDPAPFDFSSRDGRAGPLLASPAPPPFPPPSHNGSNEYGSRSQDSSLAVAGLPASATTASSYFSSTSSTEFTSVNPSALWREPSVSTTHTSSSPATYVSPQSELSGGQGTLAQCLPPSPSLLLRAAQYHQHALTPAQGQSLPSGEPQNQFAMGDNYGAAAASHASAAPKRGPRWSDAEDAILRACVQREGTKWQNVHDLFTRSGGNLRTIHAIEHRWQDISLRDRRQLASTNPAAASLPRREGHRLIAWSEEEKSVLCKSISKAKGSGGVIDYPKVYGDFFKAFPETQRTWGAVRSMVARLVAMARREQEAGRENEKGEEGSEARDSSGDAQGAGPSHLVTYEAAPETTQSRACSASSAPRATPSPTASLDPRLQALRPSQAQPLREDEAKQRAQQGEDLDVNVIHHAEGITIEGSARGHHVVIYAPGFVKITRQGPPPTLSSFGQRYEPAFHFQVLEEEGTIIPLRVPQGTRATVTRVSLEEGQAVDTMFESADGYYVLFRTGA